MRTPRHQGRANQIVGPTLALGLVALLGIATAAPAAAGDVKGKISFGQRQVDRHHDRGFNVSIRFGERDRGHRYDRGRDRDDDRHRKHDRGDRYDRRGREGGHHRAIDHSRCGYYKQVWSPPRYAYRYDTCGRRYRVLVKPGCYQRVWVAQCMHNRPRGGVCR